MRKFFSVFSLVLVLFIISVVLISPIQAFATNEKSENKSEKNECKGGDWWNWKKWKKQCNEENQPPVVYLFATKYSIKSGGNTKLYLKTKNEIDSCVASGGWSGERQVDVREKVSPLVTTTYTITCTNPFGSYTDSVEIYVKSKKATTTPPATTTPQVTLNFSGNPLNIMEEATSTLSWTSTNATLCLASNGWTGEKSFSGNQIVSSTATTTYTLACGNVVGTSTQSVTVNVSPKPVEPPPPPPAPTLTFTGSPLSIIVGATSTLTWSSTNATLCVASNGWIGEKAFSDNLVVAPTATTTYTLSCGNSTSTSTESVTIDVAPTTTQPVTFLDHLVISEVYYDVDSSKGAESTNEWIEIHNNTGSTVDISDWVVADSSDEFDLIPSGTIIPQGGFLVLTASSTTTGFWGNVPMVSLNNRLGNSLGNAGDSIYLKNSASTTIDSMSYGSTTPEVFSPTAPDIAEGHSLVRTNLLSDTNTASDWADQETPTPGSF